MANFNVTLGTTLLPFLFDLGGGAAALNDDPVGEGSVGVGRFWDGADDFASGVGFAPGDKEIDDIGECEPGGSDTQGYW